MNQFDDVSIVPYRLYHAIQTIQNTYIGVVGGFEGYLAKII